MDFKKLKANRSKIKEAISKLRDEREKSNEKQKIYYPKLDKNGNANVILRILPQKDINKHPVSIIYKHQHEIAGKYFSQVCPSTFGTIKDCELCQELSEAWTAEKQSGNDFPKIPGYRRKKRIVNVLVVKDSIQPDLEGTVLPMYLSATIEDKINKALFPPKADDGTLTKHPKIIQDLWEGFNLNVEIFKNSMGWSDYSESHFDVEPTPVSKTEKGIEEIFNAIADLMPDQSKVLSGEEIKEKFNLFLKVNGAETLDSDKKVKEKMQEKAQEKEKEKELEEEFNSGVVEEDSEEDSENSESDEESLPWD